MENKQQLTAETIENAMENEAAERVKKTENQTENERVAQGNEDVLLRVWRILQRCGKALERFVWAFPPIIVFAAMFLFFKLNGLYPYGNKTMSWCDMDQQVVPLLIQLKDILAGKEGLFFSFKNAGGMNFYGVFFFFLSSPFSLLVAFVDKSDVSLFANVLVTLKMCAISLTASLYFAKKHPEAGLLNIIFSVLYAFSGYVMMYYQNVMWLDIVYLFPLLLLGLEKLKEGKRLLFTVVLAACVFVNYYLSYMVVVFLLLYVFVCLILEKDKKFAGNFLLCCAVAALATAVVWLPSLVQYFTSGRKTSILESLQASAAFTAYQTTLPTVFSVLFLFPFAFSKKNADKDGLLRRVLFFATLVPLLLEPVNKMWQTGSYMSFPTRYAFITIFLCLTLAMDSLVQKQEDNEDEKAEEKEEENEGDSSPSKLPFGIKKWLQNLKKHPTMYALSAILVGVSIWYYSFATGYTKAHHATMDNYSNTLWGNAASFDALLKLYAVALAVGVLAYVLQRAKLLQPVLLWVAIGVIALSELYVAPMTYIYAPAHDAVWQQQVIELADQVDDDGFFRVKTDKEYSGHDFDVNLMGSLGYNALGHYTSLTSDGYMKSIKQLGYTSYWMEVGNSGGTILTDALLSVKYSVSHQKSAADVFQGEYYNISNTPYYLPLGIIAKEDIIKGWDEAFGLYPRAQMQEKLYADFFGGAGVTTYELKDATLQNLSVKEENGKYVLTPQGGSTAMILFQVSVKDKQTLYFNAFDESTNALKQSINGKFSVYAPHVTVNEYPAQKQNGVLCLGEYENETVTVKVRVNSAVSLRDISLFGIENKALQTAVESAESVGLKTSKNSITGSYTAKGGECVFLSVAYNEGMSLKINGKKAELYEVYDGFTAFYLKAGKNDIRLTFTPQGFVGGLCITLVGVGLFAAACVLWIWKKYRWETPNWVDTAAYYGLWIVGIAVVFVVYCMPLVLCAL
ncbi:MAG: YfhO family protein [Clostridia bacterium]|nr:YfhO family protein [Clostridia bacterium]